ncbi:CheR methyltransferase-like protein [Scopulibacillus darangshiensis]|uniref:CheR methyltransferase-like protein n=1 Tax=Scopulibacillus darangshiensis TaxID=442528 RepID=A0A4R2PBG1_9BACL|nr:CheR methyltransferase-like protein [Scopulibacillus darangshiensis]
MVSLDYDIFKKRLFELTGINLTLYKEDQMKRRLNSLRLKHGIDSFADYYQKLAE